MRLGAYDGRSSPRAAEIAGDLRRHARSPSATATATRSTPTTASGWRRRACASAGMSPDGLLPEIVELPGPPLVHRRAVPPGAEDRARSSRTRCSRASSPRPWSRAGWCEAGGACRRPALQRKVRFAPMSRCYRNSARASPSAACNSTGSGLIMICRLIVGFSVGASGRPSPSAGENAGLCPLPRRGGGEGNRARPLPFRERHPAEGFEW